MGAMLGSGIFVLPGLAAAIAGPWVGASYLLAGLLVLPALLSKAELSTAMPVAGGSYVYVDRALGPLWGTITGLGTWFTLAAKTAFALVGLGSYLALFTDFPPVPFALGVLALLLLFNAVGVGKASAFQVGVVAVSLASLFLFAVLGAPRVEPGRFVPALPHGFVGLFEGAAFVFVSYAGVTKVASVAEEVHHPGRNLPRGMFFAQGTVMLLYAAVATVVVGVLPMERLSTDLTPIASAAGAVLGPVYGRIMAAVAILGLVSMCNAGVMAATRYPFAMGRDRLLPPAFEQVSPRFGTPTRSILLTGLLLALLVTTLPVVELAKLASAFTIFLFSIDNLALIVLRESGARWYRPDFRAPLYPWTQVAGIAGSIWLLAELGSVALWGVGGALLLGTAWYYAYSRRRVTRKGALRGILVETSVLRATAEAEQHEAHAEPSEVLVAVLGDEHHPELLVEVGAALLEQGEMEVLRVEEAPDPMMLAVLARDDAAMRALEAHCAELERRTGKRVHFHDIVTHDARETLARHASHPRTEWLLMCCPDRHSLRLLLRSSLNWWLNHPPADLAVLWDRRPEGAPPVMKRILVLALPGPYDTLLVHAADRLAQHWGGELTLLLPVPESEPRSHWEAHQAYHEQLMALCRSPVRSRLVRTVDAAWTVQELSADYDLLVLGAPPETGLRGLFRSPEMDLVHRARCSVLRLKAPRHRRHARLAPAVLAPHLDEDLHPYLDAAVYMPRVPIARSADLWVPLARFLAAAVDVGRFPAILEALEKREACQTTAGEGGYALNTPTVVGLTRPLLGVFTLENPVELGSRRQERVDVVLTVLAGPGQRRSQLWLADLLGRMARQTGLLRELRAARNQEALALALARAARELREPEEE